MITDDELLTAVGQSFAGARLSTPLDATIRRGRNLTVQTSGSGYGWSPGLVQATRACTGS